MPRPATGSIREKTLSNGRTAFYARFSLPSEKYPDVKNRRVDDLPLGRTPEFSRELAEEELANILADVRRGKWTDPRTQPQPAASSAQPLTFHVFASDWWAGVVDDLSENTRKDYLWRLGHLLDYFASWELGVIDAQAVDRYRVKKRKTLGPESVNKTIRLLGAILDLADEYKHITGNAARGKRRLAKVDSRAARRSWVDYDHLQVLFEAAQQLEAERPRCTYRIGWYALLTLLFVAGMRVSEACELQWADVLWHRGVLRIGRSKTSAGVRDVRAPAVVFAALSELRAMTPFAAPTDPVVPTARGRHRDRNNVRQRVLPPLLERASKLCALRGLDPLPDKLTSHSGRRTAITLWLEARRHSHDSADSEADWVARQVGLLQG